VWRDVAVCRKRRRSWWVIGCAGWVGSWCQGVSVAWNCCVRSLAVAADERSACWELEVSRAEEAGGVSGDEEMAL